MIDYHPATRQLHCVKTPSPSTTSAPMVVLSTRLSPGDLGLVVALASLARASVAAVVRDLVRAGAQARLRELARPTCTSADDAPGAVQAVARPPVRSHTSRRRNP